MNERSQITRRIFLSALASTACAAAQTDNPTWAAPVAKTFPEPAWWDEGIVFVGNWEPLVYRLRLGLDAVMRREHGVDVVERYRREHTEETVLKLKEAGVNLIIAHFYKTGLESDREDIELTKQLAGLCHKHGMKIGVYIGDTIFTETMLRDMPEAAQWVRYTESGDPVRYPGQPYRYRADFNHPGYVEHMKKVIRIAVHEVKADLVHFDNVLLRRPPYTGDTPEINRRFREFLRNKYTPDQLKNRFGFSDIRNLRVPSWSGVSNPAGVAKITDPVIQEWVDFRCHDLADYYGKLADYVRSLKPDVVVEMNPHGLGGDNRAFLEGVDHARLVPHGSAYWTEESNNAEVDGQGILVSKIRSYKAARSLGRTLFAKCRFLNDPSVDPVRRSVRLRMSEAMAFNRNCLGDVGKPLDVYEIPEEARQYIRFYRDNNRYFTRTRTVADVAVLRSFPSMAYNSVGSYVETVLVEQLLIQHKIPFHIVFDQHLEDLSGYRALILANQDSLSDRALDQIREYVKGGGGLLATGQTSVYTEWRRLRGDFGLADVLGVRLAADHALPPERRDSFGKDRVAYLPAVVPAAPIPTPGRLLPAGFTREYWKLPKNAEQILSAIRYVAGEPFSVEFDGAPLTTVMELTEKKDGGMRVLHWLNYNLGTTAGPARVTLAVPAGRKVTGIELLSPERGAAESLDFRMEGNRVSFQMPALRIYNLAAVSFGAGQR